MRTLLILAALLPTAAHGAIIATAVEEDGNIVIRSDGGTLDYSQFRGTFLDRANQPAAIAGYRVVLGGDIFTTFYSSNPDFVTTNPLIAEPGWHVADLASGPNYGVEGGHLIVPYGYTSGDLLAPAEATWLDTTFAAYGMRLGTHYWEWDAAGGTRDSFTLNVVPEPSTLIYVTCCAAIGCLLNRQSQRP